jgi:hypothetical protein
MMLSIERYGAIQPFNICRMILRPSTATPDRVKADAASRPCLMAASAHSNPPPENIA